MFFNLSSLVPGHTHEDIDAFFSRLWKALKTRAGILAAHCWSAIFAKILQVYPGWNVIVNGFRSGVVVLDYVWQFQRLFGQGKGLKKKHFLLYLTISCFEVP